MQRFEMELIILEYLVENPYTNLQEIRNNAVNGLKERGRDINDESVLLINSIIWDLIFARILTPGKDMDNLELPFVHVSNMDGLKSRFNKDTDL